MSTGPSTGTQVALRVGFELIQRDARDSAVFASARFGVLDIHGGATMASPEIREPEGSR